MSKEDAEKFEKLIKTKDKTEFINYIVTLSNDQRQDLRKAYKEAYKKELIDVVNKELSSDFKNTVVAYFKDETEYDVEELKRAMKGAGTDEETLIEILTSRTPDEMKKINEKYQEVYNTTLEKDVIGDTSGNFLELLKGLLTCTRSRNSKPKRFYCQSIAKEIYDTGETKKPDTALIIRYFSSLSPIELQRVCQEYYKLSGKTMLEFIEKKFSGDFKNTLKAVVYAVISPSEYMATRILKSIKGAGTDERLLSRIIITRYHRDMEDIKMFFNKLYNKDMMTEIADDISGDYLKLVNALCNK